MNKNNETFRLITYREDVLRCRHPNIPSIHLKQKNPQHRTYRKIIYLAQAEAYYLYNHSKIQMLPNPKRLAEEDRYNLKDQRPKRKDLQGGMESTQTVQIGTAAAKSPGSSKPI